MKGLYQILAEDYRDYQIKEPIRENSKKLIESTRPSKVAKQKALKESTKVTRTSKVARPCKNREKLMEAVKAKRAMKEACEDKECKDKEVIKGAEDKEAKKPLVKEDEEEVVEEVVEEPTEEVIPDEVEEDTPEEVLSKIAMVAGLSKEEIENAMAELPEEEKESVKANFTAIKNTAMELFPEEVAEDVEEITEEIPEEIEEEPLEECEITSFKVTRIAPKVGAVMIEAQTKEGLKYITGKNFNESEKTLDEAEISTDKSAAANRFKGFLK